MFLSVLVLWFLEAIGEEGVNGLLDVIDGDSGKCSGPDVVENRCTFRRGDGQAQMFCMSGHDLGATGDDDEKILEVILQSFQCVRRYFERITQGLDGVAQYARVSCGHFCLLSLVVQWLTPLGVASTVDRYSTLNV
jgi:hypothetical protein